MVGGQNTRKKGRAFKKRYLGEKYDLDHQNQEKNGNRSLTLRSRGRAFGIGKKSENVLGRARGVSFIRTGTEDKSESGGAAWAWNGDGSKTTWGKH